MAMLREDFRDEILSESMNGRRRFRVVENDDGTVSFEDETVLAQAGDDYGQKEINQLNHEVNHSIKKDELIKSLAITEEGMVMDGKTCSENLIKALGTTLTGTLAAGETILTFTSTAITDDSLIDVYVKDAFGVAPTAIVQSGNTLTLTFDAQTFDLMVKVRLA